MALQTKTLTANGSKGHHKFTLTVTEDSINTAENSSTISFNFKISPIVSGYNWISYGNIKYSINIGETSYSGTILNYDGSSTVTLKSGSLSITHDSNGDKTINISFAVTDPNTSVSYTCGPASSSNTNNTMTLTKIARASSVVLSTDSIDVGGTITATITRANTSFTHKVEFYINSSYTQSYTSVATSQSFTIPTSWCAYMPNTTSCTAYCRVTTYNGSTQIGDPVTTAFTINVPSTIKPSGGSITFNPTYLVKGKSTVTVSASGWSAGSGSTIASYTFSGPSLSQTTNSASATSSTVLLAGTLEYTVTVTDTRGRSASASKTIICYDYFAPYFTSFEVYRSDDSGNKNAKGTYLTCQYAISYASVGNNNKTTVKLHGVTSSAITMSNGKHTVSVGNSTTPYQVYATVTDTYTSAATQSSLKRIVGESRTLNIHPTGTGVAVGQKSSKENSFECAWAASFYNGLDVSSNKVTSVATPTANTDAANKKYVDDTINSHVHKNASLNPACVEFTGATGHGGYIDFHYGGSTTDYTSRIIESSSGVVALNDSPIVTPAAPNGFHYLGVKTSLPSGANFNTYITPGQWATNTYDTASTFSNCPYVTAGSLTVYYSDTTANEIHQIWESRDYKVYERFSSNGGSTWSAWNKRLTSANVVAIYSASVSFSNGEATYTHSSITASSIVMVQRRSSTVGNNQQFNVHSNKGSATICTTSTTSATLTLNIIIINN